MATMIKLISFNCELCGLGYQSTNAYLNGQNQVTCVDCLDFDITKVGA